MPKCNVHKISFDIIMTLAIAFVFVQFASYVTCVSAQRQSITISLKMYLSFSNVILLNP